MHDLEVHIYNRIQLLLGNGDHSDYYTSATLSTGNRNFVI